MKNRFYFMKLLKFSNLLIVLVGIWSCGGTMQVVEKSVEEGNLVPSTAVSTVDFLNEYHHALPEPTRQVLDVDIALERDNVLATGDSIYVQVGLATRRPTISPVQMHALVYNPVEVSSDDNEKMTQAIAAIADYQSKLPEGSSLTIDTATPLDIETTHIKRLQPTIKANHLLDFLRPYVRMPLSQGKHHFILVVGDVAGLSQQQRQNIVDMAKILRVKSATLSVLAVDDEPQIAFLQKLSRDGNGVFTVLTKRFRFEDWLTNEVRIVNARKITDIKVVLHADYNARIESIVSPTNLGHEGTSFSHTVDELVQGDDYVLLAKIDTPPLSTSPYNQIVRVEAEYFDSVAKKFVTINESTSVNFVLDKNDIINNTNDRVSRSLLILHTQAIIGGIEPVLREKRYYQAVAVLTEHSLKLNEFAADHDDSELKRDSEILNAYAQRLYDFDEKTFQSLKIWHDMSWDRSRYSTYLQ
jgi:hypothetical protein